MLLNSATSGVLINNYDLIYPDTPNKLSLGEREAVSQHTT